MKHAQLIIYSIRRTNRATRKPMRTRYGWRLKAPNGEIIATGAGGKLRSFATRQLAWHNFTHTIFYGNGSHSVMLPSACPVRGSKGSTLLTHPAQNSLRVSVDCEV